MKISVILGGNGGALEVFKGDIEDSNLIIACDRGGDWLKHIGIIPDILIGDMDSITKETIDYFEEKRVKIIKFDRHKDFTDAYLAFKHAFNEYKRSDINVYAYTGGRGDHYLSALIDAEKFIDKKRNIRFIDEGSEIHVTANSIELQGNIGDLVSVFSFSGAETSECSGLLYNVSNMKFSCGMTRGVSNELTENKAYITIKKGKLIIFHYVN